MRQAPKTFGTCPARNARVSLERSIAYRTPRRNTRRAFSIFSISRHGYRCVLRQRDDQPDRPIVQYAGRISAPNFGDDAHPDEPPHRFGGSTPPRTGAPVMAPRNVDRRAFLQATVAGAVMRVAAHHGFVPSTTHRPRPQPRVWTPDAAIAELLAGNRRFVGNQLTSIKLDGRILRERTVDEQEPFAGVLGCADSRVPVELVFDQSIGHLFVARVAGNIVTPEIIATLEYGVAVLGIRALLVLGHTNCGAVNAAMQAKSVPGQISSLYPHLRAAVDRSGGNVDKAIEANARLQAELLRTSSTVIREATAAGRLKVVAGVYNLATGKVIVT
jgi:carbonic anhydrase